MAQDVSIWLGLCEQVGKETIITIFVDLTFRSVSVWLRTCGKKNTITLQQRETVVNIGFRGGVDVSEQIE